MSAIGSGRAADAVPETAHSVDAVPPAYWLRLSPSQRLEANYLAREMRAWLVARKFQA